MWKAWTPSLPHKSSQPLTETAVFKLFKTFHMHIPPRRIWIKTRRCNNRHIFLRESIHNAVSILVQQAHHSVILSLYDTWTLKHSTRATFSTLVSAHTSAIIHEHYNIHKRYQSRFPRIICISLTIQLTAHRPPEVFDLYTVQYIFLTTHSYQWNLSNLTFILCAFWAFVANHNRF